MTAPKKIICLIGQLGGGGTEKQLYLFLKHLDRSLFEPSVVVSSAKYRGGIWEARIRDELGIRPLYLFQMGNLLKFMHFKYLLSRIRPDIVFSWSFYTNAFNALCAGGSKKVKFIGSLRGSLDVARAQLSPSHFRYALSPPRIVVNSVFLKRQLQADGTPPDKITVINNIYEMDEKLFDAKVFSGIRERARKRLGIPPEGTVIAGAGRDTPEKNFEFFIEVFDKLSKNHRDMYGLLVGSIGSSLRRKIRNRGLQDKIRLAGEVSDVVEELTAADIFFLSSKSEGMPNVLLEAIDGGCAVVATDVGGVRDILGDGGQYGRIVRNGDVNSSVESLASLIKDKNLMFRLAIKGKERLTEFGAEHTMPKYYAVLDR